MNVKKRYFKITRMAVILETSLGNLTVDLLTDERPICKFEIAFA